MNKIIGIDYGNKKVGVAVSSDNGRLAFPVDVVENRNIYTFLDEFAKQNDIKKVVIGESKQFNMDDNPIMEDIRIFKEKLEKMGFEVSFENEFMTSIQASRIQGYNKKQDASAAALLLQAYLDKQND